MMDEAGYVLGNLDATIYAERPKCVHTLMPCVLI